jgi:hypothetical protein
VRSANHEAPHYALFSSLLSLSPWSVRIFFSILFFPYCDNEVPHPHKSKVNMTVLHTFIFLLFDSTWEDKRFWTEWYQALFLYVVFGYANNYCGTENPHFIHDVTLLDEIGAPGQCICSCLHNSFKHIF